MRIFILVSLLGFPVALGFIALAFAWYFKGQPSYRDGATPPVAAAAPAATAESAKPAIAANSIAVMPFLNMSADPEQEYFSDGMTEEILNALAKVFCKRGIAAAERLDAVVLQMHEGAGSSQRVGLGLN